MVNFRAAMEENDYQIGVPSETPTSTAVALNPFDLTSIKALFIERYSVTITAMTRKASEVQVKDEPTAKLAVEMASQAKRLSKQIEDQRKAAIKDPQEYVKGVNTLAKSFTEPLDGIEATLKGKINTWQREQERIRQERERAAREAAAALQRKLEEDARKEQARLDAEAKAKGTESVKVDPVIVPEVIIPQMKTITRTEEGSASIRKVWTWKLLDFAKLPDEYKRIDEVKLNQAVKAGLREIAGCEIFEETKTVIRA